MDLIRLLFKVALIVIAIIIITLWFYPSNEDFRLENPFWNGLKKVNQEFSLLPLRNLADLNTHPGGKTLIIVPYLSFTPNELDLISKFVSEGGLLILTDDFGYGNQILEHLGIKTRFSGALLFDPLFNYKNRWFPKISHLTQNELTSNVNHLVLNHATVLLNVETQDVLAKSSSFSFLDENDNKKHDETEPVGPLPVVAKTNVGKGILILISDPSLFINSMIEMEGNNKFISNLFINSSKPIFITQTHLPQSNLHKTKDLLTMIRNHLMTPIGTFVALILIITLTFLPLWRRRRL